MREASRAPDGDIYAKSLKGEEVNVSRKDSSRLQPPREEEQSRLNPGCPVRYWVLLL